MPTQIDQFLTEMVLELTRAERSFRHGDAEPRIRMWSPIGPTSWLGQFGTVVSGAHEIAEHFRRVAARFADPAEFRLEVLVVDVRAESAYLVAREYSIGTLDDLPGTELTSRIARVFRREHGEWRIAHGHADLEPATLSLPFTPPRTVAGADHDH